MQVRLTPGTLAALAALVSSTACSTVGKSADKEAATDRRVETLDREPLGALPPVPKLDPRAVALGRKLFDDKRLSADDTVACASCHDLAHGGVDGLPRSRGVGGKLGTVNAPTVYNAALNFALFWDGRAKTLEEQAAGPVANPLEMNESWDTLVAKLKADAEYPALFAQVFKDGVTADNVRSAIATFERTLLTPDSPFDRWIRGDAQALGAEAQEGYQTFKSVGCVACHQGANVGGNMFQRFGVMGDYFRDRGGVTEADYGRFNVTHDETDRFVFRVPSLRNVERTAPYFHDGSAKTLRQAIGVMAKYQLGRPLSDHQTTVIEAFLQSLSGPAAAGGGG